MGQWLNTARRGDVVKRSLRVAAIVGSILVIINYSDRMFAGTLVFADGIKMVLTYFVPYGVSTYASVSAILRRE